MSNHNNMEDIEILCKHLSEKLNVKIRFEEGAVPATNGQEIILPTNINKGILFELLGTLLHETFHIRHTDFDVMGNPYAIKSELMKDVMNVLEDIRIDTRALEKYPQGSELFYMLYKYATQKYGEQLKQDPFPWRILKHLILKARIGEDFQDFYYDQEALKVIEKLGLDEFIVRAKNAKRTSDLLPHAQEIIRRISEFVKEQQGMPQPQFDMGTAGNQQGNMRKQQDKIDSKQKKMDDLRQKMDTTRQEHYAKNEEWRKAEQSVKTAITNIDKKENKINDAQSMGDQEQVEKLEKQLEKAEFKLENEKRPKMLDAMQKTQDLKEKGDKLSQEWNKSRQEQEFMQRGLYEMEADPNSEANMFGSNGELDIFGFSAIGQTEFTKKPTGYETQLSLSKTLDQKLREFFVEKREERQQEEDGNRLNRNRLCNLFTTGNNLFTQQNEINEKTNIIFLLDNSGSMGANGRSSILISALTTLLNSLNRVVEEENLPVDLAVYTFDTQVECLKSFEENLSCSVIAEKYKTRGGTCLLRSVNKMSDIFQEKGDSAKNILVVITDAEVGYDELRALRNQVHTEMRTVYIGMDVRFQCKEAEELFSEGNIKTKDEIVDIISKVISE